MKCSTKLHLKMHGALRAARAGRPQPVIEVKQVMDDKPVTSTVPVQGARSRWWRRSCPRRCCSSTASARAGRRRALSAARPAACACQPQASATLSPWCARAHANLTSVFIYLDQWPAPETCGIHEMIALLIHAHDLVPALFAAGSR